MQKSPSQLHLAADFRTIELQPWILLKYRLSYVQPLRKPNSFLERSKTNKKKNFQIFQFWRQKWSKLDTVHILARKFKRRSSLRSHCYKLRLFMGFSNTILLKNFFKILRKVVNFRKMIHFLLFTAAVAKYARYNFLKEGIFVPSSSSIESS